MNILMFGWEFPPFHSGGLGVACFGLTRALAKGGFSITFVLPKKINVSSRDISFAFVDTDVGITVESVDALLTPYMTGSEYEQVRGENLSTLYGNTLIQEIYRYARLARDIARRTHCDVIHAHDWLSILAGIEAKRVTGKPLIFHVHATEFDRSGGRGVNQLVYEIERKGVEQADAVIAVSMHTKNILVTRYGAEPSKIYVVHNGIEIDDYAHTDLDQTLTALKAAGNKIVLSIGRITLQKGVDYFVATAAKVLSLCPNTYFIISGSGDMEGQIMRQVASLGISDKVMFTGWIADRRLANALYRTADVFVMPSVSEPFGITPLESLVHGTPVVISKQSGVSEILTSAFKVDFWDVDEMTNVIVALLEYRALHGTMGHNGKKEVRRISWKAAAEKCATLYYTLSPK